MNYLLDTNICIYIIKKQPAGVLKHLMSHQVGDLGISSITVAELQYGVEKSLHKQKNQMALAEFMSEFEIMPFNEGAAECYGKIRGHLEKKGIPIGPLDMMIAAHAQSLNAILVTNNVKEFSRIPHLRVENWALSK